MANALTPASSAESSPSPKTPGDIPSTEEGLGQQTKLFKEILESRPLAKLEEEQGFEPDEETTNGGGDGKRGGEPEVEMKPAGEKEEDGPTTSTQAESQGKPASSSEEMSKLVSPTKGEEKPKEEGRAPTPKSEAKSAAKLDEHHQHRHRKQFLNVNDHELKRVEQILTEIHTDYYDAYDSRSPGSKAMPLQCDVPLLIGEIKDQVLSGCVIVFTGVIAINQKPQDSDIWQQAEAFGAQCQVELDERVTHCVIGSIGTEKMRRASRMPNVQVVWLAWLQTSIAFWKREPEDPFRPQIPRIDTPPKPEDKVPDAMQIDPEDIEKDAEDFKAAWDDAAQAELDELINGDDDDDWSSSSEGEGDGDEKNDRKRAASRSPSRWSRENTPSRSILSRGPSPGPPKHVRYADDENQPLEDVREPQPGDIPSYPPKKKQKVLMLDAPSDDDDIPEANKMVYKPRPGDGITGEASTADGADGKADGKADGADGTDGADPASSDTETDEFAKMLEEQLAEE